MYRHVYKYRCMLNKCKINSIEGKKTNKDNFLQHCHIIIIILLISIFSLLYGGWMVSYI